jgi:hypothetical protein
MSMLNELLAQGRPVTRHMPYPRVVVDPRAWSTACIALADGTCTLLGLWAEADSVHMALLDEAAGAVGLVSLPCPDRRYPSVGRLHPPALRLERAIRDLFGLEPEGLPDSRPWLDHGHWGTRHPLGPTPPDRAATPYAFLPAEGPSLNQIAVGPVHAGIIEPGHFRFTTSGETVVRLEQRLGYTHKGVESLLAGAALDQAVRLAGRVSGDSTVAYALAFSRAAEAALGTEAPPRAAWLRALMAELERLANHLGDIGAICNDASFSIMHAHCGGLRERVLRAADTVFGHRLMRDLIVPGGVTTDIDGDGAAAIRATVAEIRERLPKLIAIYDNTASLVPLFALRCARLRGPASDGRGRERPRLDPHPRGRAEPRPSRADPRHPAARADPERAGQAIRAGGRHVHRRRVSRRSPGLVAAGRERRRCPLPSAGSVLVPVAAPGGRDRRQHRRRLPALQQVVQLLLFGPGSLS